MSDDRHDRDDPAMQRTIDARATAPTLADSSSPSTDTPSSPNTDSRSQSAVTTARYELGEVIGRGGMGEVVTARDDQIGRTVAIKRMRGDASPGAIARFVHEAQIQGRLDHPAIVPVHELGHDMRGRPYFVMKQLAGATLSTVIGKLADGDPATAKAFPRTRLLRAFAEVCLAIEFAHHRNVIHRDLKPANVMLGDYGEVYVLDWGIARVLGERTAPSEEEAHDAAPGMTAAGAVLGTPGYMAPEQIRGGSVDGRADVYALGCVLFELLANAPLHPSGSAGLASALAGKVDARGAGVDPELDAIVVAATTADPNARIASARELGDRVQRFLDGDRDLALRKALAEQELARARSLAEVDPDHPDAFRAANRALALDPGGGAAELVAALMQRPPRETPPEVEVALRRADDTALQASAAMVARLALLVALAVPLMYGLGSRSWVGFGAILASAATIAVGALAVQRRVSVSLVWMVFFAHVVVVLAFARISSPWLLAPGLATVNVMATAIHSRFVRPMALAVATLVPVLGVIVLEAVGVLSPTYWIAGKHLVLHVDTTSSTTLIGVAMSCFFVAIIAVPAFLVGQQADRRRATQRELELRAWKLGQLVTSRVAAPSS
ncbi:MAG: serine/threonine-protein kinase [Kofleriaceae bacterium]